MPALYQRPVVGGIGAHVALTRSARQEAQTHWLAVGGTALLQDGKETAESLAHFEVFQEHFVDEELRKAYQGAIEASSFLGKCSEEATSADRLPLSPALRAEAALVAERSHAGRVQEDLCAAKSSAAGKGWSWRLQAAVQDASLESTSARGQPLLMRQVVDEFCSAQQCRALCGHAIHAMMGKPSHAGQTAIPAGSGLGEDAGASVRRLFEQTRTYVESSSALAQPLFFAGAVLSRMTPAGTAGCERQHVDGSGPYRPHIDRARVASDDYAAVLYLGTQGEHFDGGGLAFVDAEADRWVAPRQARLLTFSTGPENLHRVEPVTRGARFTLAMWFTLSEEHAAQAPSLPDLEVRLQADASRMVSISALSSPVGVPRYVQSADVDPEVYDIVAEDDEDTYDKVD